MGTPSCFHSNVSMVPDKERYLERSRVCALLEKAVEKPIVSVVASAGYGKSQAVYSFVRKANVNTIWIQLSVRDNMVSRFWENFIRAVAFLDPESAEKLEKFGFPETERQYYRYFAVPQKEIIAHQRYFFVYDDIHLVQEASVLRFLERTVTSPFPNVTSILISRNEPRMDLTGNSQENLLARLDQEELRFSMDETLEYFRMLNIKPSPEIAERIYRDSEGWAFAIHLAALALKNDTQRSSGYALFSAKFNVFRLIENEVIAVISPELRKFLIRLSLIEIYPLDLVRELAESSGVSGEKASSLLLEIDLCGSFIRYDPYYRVYRIHKLLLEYLSGKQKELSEDEKREVYRKAAHWCGENNLRIDAFSYYDKAGEYDKFFEMIYSIPCFLPHRLALFLLEIFEHNIPPAVFAQNSNAWTLYIRILLCLGFYERAEKKSLEIIAKLEAEPLSPYHYRTILGCYINLGYMRMIAAITTRDYQSYGICFEKAYQYYLLSGCEVMGAVDSSVSSYVCNVSASEKGETEKYLDSISRCLPYVAEMMRGHAWGIDDLARAEFAWFRGEISMAEDFALKALSKAGEQKQYEIASRAVFYLLRIHIFKGDYEEIERLLKVLENQLGEKDFFNRYLLYDIETGWFHLQTGASDKLASWLKNDFEENDLNSYLWELEVLVRAKYHFMENRYAAALSSLKSRKKSGFETLYLFGRIEGKILEALCFYQLKDTAAAAYALEAAYRLAQGDALYMPFIEMGKDMRALAGALLASDGGEIPRSWLTSIKRSAAAYAKKLFFISERLRLNSVPVPGSLVKSADRVSLPEKQDFTNYVVSPLSRRELSVLTGLSRGLTREEIAGDSGISVNTVKSAVKNVYNKLGAVNRADAVRIATGLGILKKERL